MALKAKVLLLAYCLDSEGEIYHWACQNWVWLWEKSHSNNPNCLPPLMSSNYKYLGISKYLKVMCDDLKVASTIDKGFQN